MKTWDDTTRRRPSALLAVGAAHVVLAWAVLSAGADRAAWPAHAGPEQGLRLVPVRLLPLAQAAEPPPVMPQAPRDLIGAAPPPMPAPPMVALGTRSAAPTLDVAPAPALAGTALEAASATASDAPAAAPAAPPPIAPATPERAAPVLAAAPNVARNHGDGPDVAVARADRRQCPPAPHPAALRDRGIEGAVVLRVRVDVQGRAADVQVINGSGWRLFDEAALQQARGCRFIPATQGGQAIDSWVEFPVRFALAG